jgi:hypothetical protein
MYAMWITIGYLADQARSRIRNAVRNDAGALTLEWIVIAVALVAAGGIAAALFDASIRSEANNLP